MLILIETLHAAILCCTSSWIVPGTGRTGFLVRLHFQVRLSEIGSAHAVPLCFYVRSLLESSTPFMTKTKQRRLKSLEPEMSGIWLGVSSVRSNYCSWLQFAGCRCVQVLLVLFVVSFGDRADRTRVGFVITVIIILHVRGLLREKVKIDLILL